MCALISKQIKKRDLDYFDNLIQERAKSKPIAQIIKKKDFWKYEFIVNNNVLIPRPDTEILIEQTLKLVKNKNRLQILDIGIGSGCILMSILKEKKILRHLLKTNILLLDHLIILIKLTQMLFLPGQKF